MARLKKLRGHFDKGSFRCGLKVLLGPTAEVYHEVICSQGQDKQEQVVAAQRQQKLVVDLSKETRMGSMSRHGVRIGVAVARSSRCRSRSGSRSRSQLVPVLLLLLLLLLPLQMLVLLLAAVVVP